MQLLPSFLQFAHGFNDDIVVFNIDFFFHIFNFKLCPHLDSKIGCAGGFCIDAQQLQESLDPQRGELAIVLHYDKSR